MIPTAAPAPGWVAIDVILLAAALAVAAAVLYRRYRSRRELAERAAELAILGEIGKALAASPLEPEELAEVAFEEAARLMETDFFQVGLFEGDCYRTLIWIRDCSRVENAEFHLAEDEPGIVGWVRRTGQPLWVPDFQSRSERPPAEPGYQSDDPTACGIFAPLTAGAEVFGVVSVQSRRPNAFREHHLRLLSILANDVASALATSSLQTEIRSYHLQIDLMQQLSWEMTHSQTITDLLTAAVRLLHAAFEAYSVRLYEHVEDGLLLRAAADDGAKPAPLRLQMGEDLVGRAAAESSPLASPHPTGGGEGDGPSEVAIPLRIEDRVLGVLYLGSPAGRPIPPEHQDLGEMVASQLAIAMAEARNSAQQQEETWVNTVLLEVARHAARPGDSEEALQAVLQLTTLLAGTAWAILLLPDPAQGSLRIGPQAGLPRQRRAERANLHLSPEALGILLPYRESEAPLRVEVPALLADHLGGAREAVALTLSDGASLLGVLLLEGHEFSGRRPALLAGIAHQISLRLENTRLIEAAAARRSLEREISMARGIQESFLPKQLPSHPDWDLGTTWRVAREVGGDFYDFIPLAAGPDGPRWGIVIADVAGKGVPAALFMALCRTLLRSVAISRIDPGITLARLNDLIFADTQTDMFVSVFYAVWEPQSARLSYANGGHNPPLIFQPGRAVRELQEHGMVLGVGQEIAYETHSLTLPSGSLLLLYTDGVTETMDERGDPFGVPRLKDHVLTLPDWRAQHVADSLAARVQEHCAEPDLPDDLTVVVIRRTG